jgi:hypothetical protein
MRLPLSAIQILLSDVTNIMKEERRPETRIHWKSVQFRPSNGKEKRVKQELVGAEQDGSCAQT